MKLRYLAISLLLHLSALLINVAETAPEAHPEEVVIELQEGNQPKNGRDVAIKEMNGEGEEKAKNFYWGLGISGLYRLYNGDYVYEITKVYPGYNGELAGLQDGDMVHTVNGKNPLAEDISGDEPRKLVIAFFRIDKLSGIQYNMKVKTERGKVYY